MNKGDPLPLRKPMEPSACLFCGKYPAQHEPSTMKCLFEASYYRAPVSAPGETPAGTDYNNMMSVSCCHRCRMPMNGGGPHIRDTCIKNLGEQISKLVQALKNVGYNLSNV